MGLFDFLKRKKPEEAKPEEKPPEKAPAQPLTPSEVGEADRSAAQPSQEVCSACSQPGADKHWGGMAWHKGCLRKTRKMAKSMI
jgi:hypothetical protein